MKKLLDESKATLIDEDVYLGDEEEEVSQEVKDNALIGVINDIIKQEFTLIDNLNGAIATVQSEKPDHEEEITTLLQSAVDEKNVNIGMLTKILELIDPKQSELMSSGIEKAEEIISEPASADLNKEEE